jgi:protein-L-isoaspartate(D-aspartate) O-methyltransferase
MDSGLSARYYVPEASPVKEDSNLEPLEAHRTFFAELMTAIVGVPHSRLTTAFASTPRERYLGPGPWKVFTGRGYTQTPTADLSLLYQDMVVALEEDRGINNGQPSLHALCLAALNVKEGERVTHIGAGSGYYTAILAALTTASGAVSAYEVEETLAHRAAGNLAHLSHVTVLARSGTEGSIPASDVIYVSAGASAPSDLWLDALCLAGRLLFPLTPDGTGGMPGAGYMLLVTRVQEQRYDARFVCPAMFIPCLGARDEDTAKKLAAAFRRGGVSEVRSLWRRTEPDETCWCSGNGWWLSTVENRSEIAGMKSRQGI